MIRVIDESGSAEAATSPSHGSGEFRKEGPSNAHICIIPRGATASVPFDYREAYSQLEDLICTAKARIDVLCILSDGFYDRKKSDGYSRVPEHEFQSLLFMVEDTRRAVSALDKLYQDQWPSDAVAVADSIERARQVRAARLEEEKALEALIRAHRNAVVEWEAALTVEAHDPNSGPEPSRAAVEAKAQWEIVSAALLRWRPVTFAGNADRIRYLTNKDRGYWRGVGPTEEELTMLFASLMEPN